MQLSNERSKQAISGAPCPWPNARLQSNDERTSTLRASHRPNQSASSVIYNHTAAGWCEHGRMQMFSSSNPRRLHIVSSARVQGWWRDGWRQCSGKSPSMSREVSRSDHENGRFETRTTINCKCTTVIVVRQHIQLHTLVGLVQNGSSCWTEGTIVSRARLAHSPSKRCFLFFYPTLYRRSRC